MPVLLILVTIESCFDIFYQSVERCGDLLVVLVELHNCAETGRLMFRGIAEYSY